MGESPRCLLAKSPREGRELTLEQHLLDTEHAAIKLFAAPSRWAETFPRFFRVHSEDRERWLLNLRIAALFHDIGKANADFLSAVTHRGRDQSVRHEHLSALLLHLPPTREWLGKNPLLDLEVITAAVLSHHLKASDKGKYEWCQSLSGSKVFLYLQHHEVRSILLRAAEAARLEPPPDLPKSPWSDAHEPWAGARKHGIDSAYRFRRALRRDSRRHAFLLATKAGLLAADSVASGLVREQRSIDEWIEDVVCASPLTAEEIVANVIEPRKQAVSKRTNKPFLFKPFQTGIANAGPRTLLLAACASGKTLAAWNWAQAQARERPLGRVVFLYPTRATATEGFRGYVATAPDEEIALMQGTARYELEAMIKNPDERLHSRKPLPDESEARLFSLAYWPKRYFSATVDQFFAFLAHDYGSLCMLPALADSAIIVDEVHSFDQRMFRDLVDFAKHFDVPMLCMTATLSKERRKRLTDAGFAEQLVSDDASAKHPRYRVKRIPDSNAALPIIKQCLDRGQRVLWVVNTVARCQEIAKKAAALGHEVLCYHSAFKLSDRQHRHEAVVKAFQQCERSALAVTTQVCEMSLDLDADLLVTEVAPISSLVQRMGRANRHLARGLYFRATILVYEPESERPYTREDLGRAKAFVAQLDHRDVSQHELALLLDELATGETVLDGSARFLESGYFATPGAWRDTDDHRVPCILDEDIETATTEHEQKKAIDGFIVPVPRRFARPQGEPKPLPRYLSIAPKEHYCDQLGFKAAITEGA